MVASAIRRSPCIAYDARSVVQSESPEITVVVKYDLYAFLLIVSVNIKIKKKKKTIRRAHVSDFLLRPNSTYTHGYGPRVYQF